TTGLVNNDTPLRNLFGRIDYQISPVHRVVVRQILNHDEDGSFSRNLATYNNSPLQQNSGFRFGSNGFSRVAKNNSTTAQLYSTLPTSSTISRRARTGCTRSRRLRRSKQARRADTRSAMRTARTRRTFLRTSTFACTACTVRTNGG